MRTIYRVMVLVGSGALGGFGYDEWRHSSHHQSFAEHGVVMQVDARDFGHDTGDFVVHCMDCRFQRMMNLWIEKQFEVWPYRVAWPGGSGPFNEELTRGTMLAAVAAAVRVGGISRVHLVNHRDCGGHGGSSRHADQKVERAYHEADLEQAAAVISRQFPHLEIYVYFADFDGIEEINLSAAL